MSGDGQFVVGRRSRIRMCFDCSIVYFAEFGWREMSSIKSMQLSGLCVFVRSLHHSYVVHA